MDCICASRCFTPPAPISPFHSSSVTCISILQPCAELVFSGLRQYLPTCAINSTIVLIAPVEHVWVELSLDFYTLYVSKTSSNTKHIWKWCNAGRFVGTCPITTLLESRTVGTLHCALAYCTKMAVHYEPESRDRIQSRCTVHCYKLLCNTWGRSMHVGYFMRATPAQV